MACHRQEDDAEAALALSRTLAFSVGVTHQRTLPFRHADHARETCVSCHTEGLALSATSVDCASCHQAHHDTEVVRCGSCHASVLDLTRHPVEVHVGCGGAGCHQELPFQGVPRTRQLCIACHQEQEDHKPGPPCTDCHLLPPPRG